MNSDAEWLKDAIENEDIDKLNTLIARNAVDLLRVDDAGNLPLVLAANGHPKSLARLLRERSALPPDRAHRALYIRSIQPSNSPSMLKAAIDSGNLECVQLVLDAGVDPHSVYLWDKMVCDDKSIEAVLLKAAQKFSLINALVYCNYTRALRLMEDKSLDLRLLSAGGFSALHRAVHSAVFTDNADDKVNNNRVIDKLLALGADPNQITLVNNRSVLADAFISGADPAIIEKLIAAGGRVLAAGVETADMLTQMSTSEYAHIEMERIARKWDYDTEKIVVAIENQEKWGKTIAIFRGQLEKETVAKGVSVQKKPKLMPQIKLRK